MIPEMNDLRAPSRIASAAAALVITSAILLALGLGFSGEVSRQGAERPVVASTVTKPPVPQVTTAGIAARPADRG